MVAALLLVLAMLAIVGVSVLVILLVSVFLSRDGGRLGRKN